MDNDLIQGILIRLYDGPKRWRDIRNSIYPMKLRKWSKKTFEVILSKHLHFMKDTGKIKKDSNQRWYLTETGNIDAIRYQLMRRLSYLEREYPLHVSEILARIMDIFTNILPIVNFLLPQNPEPLDYFRLYTKMTRELRDEDLKNLLKYSLSSDLRFPKNLQMRILKSKI